MNVRPKPCAVPRMADRHHWEAKLMGEVPILGYVIERLWLMIRILSTIIQGYLIKSCGTSVQPLHSVKLFE